MSDQVTAETVPPVPRTLDEATDPAWLTHALAGVTGGARITGVKVVEVLRTMATKFRFVAKWDGGEGAFCLKAFLDVDPASARGSDVTTLECDFYTKIAPEVPIRVPTAVATLVDRPGRQGVLIMRDLVVDGARFCSALEPFSPDQAAASLDQLARLHASQKVLEQAPWIAHRLGEFAGGRFIQPASLQELLDGPRGDDLTPGVRNAARLLDGLEALAAYDKGLPQTLVHGDCHAGNIYQTADGPGLIDWQLLQHGNWALDVAYHMSAILPVEVAEREEKRLLADYLSRAKGYGCEALDFDQAYEQYRRAVVWGYFLWAITRRVDPAVINVFVDRMGKAVERHGSFELLNV